VTLPGIRAWIDWYRLARVAFGYPHTLAAAYADVQFTADMKSRAVGKASLCLDEGSRFAGRNLPRKSP
jgi:hypothetical protein